MKNYILSLTMLILLASCGLNKSEDKESKEETGVQQGVVKEVLQTSNYTYLLMENKGTEEWIAVPGMDAAIGEKYYYVQNMVMENFQSKELTRIFDRVLFVQEISKDPIAFRDKMSGQQKDEYKSDVKVVKQDVKISPESGTLTLADIFSNKDKYAGMVVTVKGVVTKYNPEIMKKNWIHLQDGTEKDGKFDLVATSQLSAKVGDTLTLTGKLVLDKDFGYGYKYEVLLEDAVKK